MRIFIGLLIISTTLLLTGCGEPESAIEHSKKHLDAKYVCPMHPEIVADEAGNCSICGMYLVKNTDQTAPAPEANKH